ncbi:MAG TPA: class I SAM-dependent methyltransferase [Patescibacteria group bacterium]|uniref:Methyltransferase domain-containing protein n=1 Tax=Candidatus Woesebacteria bacterium RBG_13_46_13 TaxID=1802479 RepID=A0A1F7X501_9BACT|nr:MAG: hypothetical protein A2Y68_00180 [Candidatus Woesebacteria bacterium RBG_13_46_13]HJX58985.1 class I SAM-dependent methyltransferase [Patescibacteria group bacterium]
MSNFGKYSQYYDLIYRDKNYPEEVHFIQKMIKRFSKKKAASIISLGCGSGNHEVLLAKKGYQILGIDRSETMLSAFQKKIDVQRLGKRVQLTKADVGKFKASRKFDCGISMFNVVGYQTENKQFENMLKNVNRSLNIGGLLMFDCWHGPAVLKDRPTDRIKELVIGDRHIVRLTSSKLYLEKNLIEISFKVMDIVGSELKDVVTEVHPMRFWSIPELGYFLEKAGFELVNVSNFLEVKSKIADDKWDIFVVARKTK